MQLVRATLCFFCTPPAASLRAEFFYLAGTPAHLLAGSTTTFAVLRAPAVLSCHLRWVADRLGSARGWAQLPSLAVASASGRCLSVNYELTSAGIREAIELATPQRQRQAQQHTTPPRCPAPLPAAHLPPPAPSAAFPASAPASPSASAPAAAPAAPPATSNLIPRAATTLHHYQPSHCHLPTPPTRRPLKNHSSNSSNFAVQILPRHQQKLEQKHTT